MDTTHTESGILDHEHWIDGSKVRFWALKVDATAAALSIGRRAADVWSVRARYCSGFAIHDVRSDGGFLSRERFDELQSLDQPAEGYPAQPLSPPPS